MAVQRINVRNEMKRLYTGKALLTAVDPLTPDTLVIEHGLGRYPVFEAFFRYVGSDYIIPVLSYRGSPYPQPPWDIFAAVESGVSTEEITLELRSASGSVSAEIFFIVFPDRGQVDGS